MYLNRFSFLVVGLMFSFGKCDKELHHKPELDFGRFYDWEDCPNETYANSFEIKVHDINKQFHDDLGMTGVRLFCNDPAGKQEAKVISSYSLQEGNWKGKQICENGEWLIGFKVQIESYQGIFKDDTGANNLKMICSSGTIMDGRGPTRGVWSSLQKCERGEAICGVRTKVEDLAIGDELGLVALRTKCCKLELSANITTPTTQPSTNASIIPGGAPSVAASDTSPADRPRSTREPVAIPRETPFIFGRPSTTEGPELTTKSDDVRATGNIQDSESLYSNNERSHANETSDADDYIKLQVSPTTHVPNEKDQQEILFPAVSSDSNKIYPVHLPSNSSRHI